MSGSHHLSTKTMRYIRMMQDNPDCSLKRRRKPGKPDEWSIFLAHDVVNCRWQRLNQEVGDEMQTLVRRLLKCTRRRTRRVGHEYWFSLNGAGKRYMRTEPVQGQTETDYHIEQSTRAFNDQIASLSPTVKSMIVLMQHGHTLKLHRASSGRIGHYRDTFSINDQPIHIRTGKALLSLGDTFLEPIDDTKTEYRLTRQIEAYIVKWIRTPHGRLVPDCPNKVYLWAERNLMILACGDKEQQFCLSLFCMQLPCGAWGNSMGNNRCYARDMMTNRHLYEDTLGKVLQNIGLT